MGDIITKLTRLGSPAGRPHSSLATSVTGLVSNVCATPGCLLEAEISVSL